MCGARANYELDQVLKRREKRGLGKETYAGFLSGEWVFKNPFLGIQHQETL